MAVTTQDIAVRLGRPTPDSGSITESQWLAWISDARLLLSSGDGSHPGLGDLSALNQEALDYVVREAVVAHVRRPDDATEVAVQVDDGSTSRRYSTATGRVSIRPEWWGMLDADLDDLGAFSIVPTGDPYVAAAFNINTGYGSGLGLPGAPYYPWDTVP